MCIKNIQGPIPRWTPVNEDLKERTFATWKSRRETEINNFGFYHRLMLMIFQLFQFLKRFWFEKWFNLLFDYK